MGAEAGGHGRPESPEYRALALAPTERGNSLSWGSLEVSDLGKQTRAGSALSSRVQCAPGAQKPCNGLWEQFKPRGGWEMNKLAPKYQEKAVKWKPIDVQMLARHNLYKPDNWPFAWFV